MIKLDINDIIGWGGVSNNQIAEQLKPIMPGEEIEIEINSVGGSVFECISIFNTIREYAKSHPVSVFINGIAASAASVIALAARTVDKKAIVKVSENSLYFIHNPIDYVFGDYNEMQKMADYLGRLAAMFAGIYQGVSGQVLKKIREAMDAETWYIGAEIQEAGYATDLEIINQTAETAPEARAALIANAEMRIAAAKKQISESETRDDLEKAAALLETSMKMAIPGKTPLNSAGSLPGDTNQKPGETPPTGGKVERMSPDELKAKYPELYKQVFEMGQSAERERVTAHLKLAKEADAYETAVKFIIDGASIMTESVQSEYLALRMNHKHTQDRIDDNPKATNLADDGADDAIAMKAFENGYLGKNTGGK